MIPKAAAIFPREFPTGDRFTDFKWLYSNDPLLSAARKITAGLRE